MVDDTKCKLLGRFVISSAMQKHKIAEYAETEAVPSTECYYVIP